MNKAIDWDKFKNKTKGPLLLKSQKAYIELYELLNKNNHELLTEYINNKTKVLIDFNCGHKPNWIKPNDYKDGTRCPKCSGSCSEQAEIDLKNMVKVNRHKLLSKYVNAQTKVLIDFNCGHKPNWITPNNYKNGQRCPKCSEKCSEQAKDDFLNILKKNNHKLLSEYAGSTVKVLIDFNCGHEPYWIIPISYKRGNRCPKCRRICPEQAKEDFLNILKRNNHKLLSKYINNKTKVLIDFNCGHKPNWITPNDYKRGKRCPKCIHKGEAELHKLLIDMGYEVETEKGFDNLKDKKRLRYDFYIPKYNLLIELDGDYHREKITYKSKDMTELEKYLAKIEANERLQNTQYKDFLKDNYAKDNNIPLLRIEYFNGIVELDKWKKLIEDKIKEINLC